MSESKHLDQRIFQKTVGTGDLIELSQYGQHLFHDRERQHIGAITQCLGRFWVGFHKKTIHTDGDGCTSQNGHEFTLAPTGGTLSTRLLH